MVYKAMPYSDVQYYIPPSYEVEDTSVVLVYEDTSVQLVYEDIY